uniref:Uncharacterized protein n=1 Tax=Caenorhabditis japonica TaxID=281687 RepID=A0A8R1I397_CAEJA
MARLENNLKSLLSSVSIIKRSLELGSKKRVMKQLFSIYRLMSTSFSTFDKQTLIGFPRGSEDMAILFKDLDELPLKKVLNEGKSLSELKSLLQPISNLSSEIARAENIWNGPMRIQYANIIRQNVKVYQKMEKINITAITSFLHILNASSERLEPIGDLNNSALDEFGQHLISLQAGKYSLA